MALKTYYDYDPGVGETLGGERVKTDAKGRRVVTLNDGQADYLIHAGAVGRTPLEDVSAEHRSHLHQVMGGRIPREPGGDAPGPVRNAKQNPNTMAAALTDGFHPVLVTTESTDVDRKRSRGGKAAVSKSFEA